MAERVLVLGGTRYFGKRLVEKLVESGLEVTIATRGQAPDPFGSKVLRVRVDRDDRESMLRVFRSGSWDRVYDQICYSPREAAIACEAFAGKVGRYVHTSTQSVYLSTGLQRESDFDPVSYPIRQGGRADFPYGEAKRLAEAVFFREAEFPVAAARIPIVLGKDDYTGRLEFHIDRVRQRKPIYVSNLEAETSFIRSDEAARFLFWLGQQQLTGPINACSTGKVSIRQVLAWVEEAVGARAQILSHGKDEDHSPFVAEESRYLDNARAASMGFDFLELGSWLPSLIQEMAAAPEKRAPRI